MTGRWSLTALLGIGIVMSGGAPAAAAAACGYPGDSWQRVSPERAGMDGRRLQRAIDTGTLQESQSIAVLRRGCLVAEDRLAPVTGEVPSQSYSMAKSMTALAAIRAMTLGLLSPDDPLGSLIPEADRPHGEIRIRHLLEMTSGLRWNFFRDYNIFMPDRIHEALSVEVAKRPGTYFEYSQSGPALLAEAVERAAGEDFQAFVQRELFGPVGISRSDWRWGRDQEGATHGFFDLYMRAADYARLGELMRRAGRWRGRRLLDRHLVDAAVAPSPRNGCYGWMIWVNASRPCVGARTDRRPVDDRHIFPGLPRDMYFFSGLFGQIVAVFPSQELLVVRTGQEVPVGDTAWQADMLAEILQSITDQRIRSDPPGGRQPGVSSEDSDRGIWMAMTEPEEFTRPYSQEPLPPAGPRRARAPQLGPDPARVGPDERARVPVRCPPRWPSGGPRACVGRARVEGGEPVRYRIDAGRSRPVALPLGRGDRRALRRGRSPRRLVVARNADRGGGVRSRAVLRLARR